MEKITLSADQQKQARILSQLLAGEITTAEAAATLKKSVKWVEWKRPIFRRDGVASLIHGNTGRVPTNKISPEKRKKVQTLARRKYHKFNFQQLTEKLNSKEGIDISPTSTRRVCLEDDIHPPRPQKRRRRHRKRRDRREREGEMLQLDGSPHDWLEGRGPRLTIINFIDDATGKKWREFREGEDLEGYVRVMWRLVEELGVPESIYTDRTVIVAGASRKYKPLRDEPSGPSQFGRMMEELGVDVILANSPQAKGRVERTHGTDQDRVCSELRLAGARTREQANAVLERYDREEGDRFTVAATNSKPAWRPTPPNLADTFCIKEERVVANDNTVRVYGKIIDIPPGPNGRSYARSRVVVHRRYEGTIGVFLDSVRIGGEAARSHRAPPLTKSTKLRSKPISRPPIGEQAAEIFSKALLDLEQAP